eukprot:13685-Heterococcus_DN1.PRE.2
MIGATAEVYADWSPDNLHCEVPCTDKQRDIAVQQRLSVYTRLRTVTDSSPACDQCPAAPCRCPLAVRRLPQLLLSHCSVCAYSGSAGSLCLHELQQLLAYPV